MVVVVGRILVWIVLVGEHHHVLFKATELGHVNGLGPCLHLLLEVDEPGVFEMQVGRPLIVLQALPGSSRRAIDSQAWCAGVEHLAARSL